TPRLLMGPGPVDLYPRVLRAMSVPMQGQFDPEFRRYMTQVMALYRQVFKTKNEQTLLIDATARGGLEACMHSVIERGDKVIVPIFGRFGHLKVEIAARAGAEVIPLEAEWGTVFDPGQIEDAVKKHKPRMVAICQGDTSATVLHPLKEIGAICRKHDAILFVDATASLAGNAFETDAWQIDMVATGLQKCLSGPPGVSPVTFNERVVDILKHRRHTEEGIKPAGYVAGNGQRIQSNYFDLAMVMDYWSPQALNHHTEAASMLYAARECARVVLEEGLDKGIARHVLTSQALRAGLEAMGLKLFGDPNHRMSNVTGVYIPFVIKSHDQVRADLLQDFGIEIGTSFGPLHGKIWRIGTMGYVCRKPNILRLLASLEVVLRRHGFTSTPGAGVDAAYKVYDNVKA
ncbi:MAG: alanine--glyoxylate aminotransferase family protein, partial [Hyphomicrobiaceae bacterium]|nr:alanine--glyoxylate aminotransferase family protein [Hyphomicrobiaceae bacterium]